ncbi:MAG: hypothetical protein K2Y18_02280 [Alphaproteobacteria bacterium]|jgi:TPR repeat protein|nr:hypothetical protein [Alphaproteobacteria bacterium]
MKTQYTKLSFMLKFCSALLISYSIFAAENSLPDILSKDPSLTPYVKDLVSRCDSLNKDLVLNSMGSNESYKQNDFGDLLKHMFGDKAWKPRVHQFRNASLQELLHPYSLKEISTDPEVILLANILYAAGKGLYAQNRNYAHLQHAASLGHAGAQYKMFLVAFRLRKDNSQEFMFRSAAQGHVKALLELSQLYQGGWGLKMTVSIPIAKLLCEEAAILGSQEAEFKLEVATLREGYFNSQKNFQQGIRKTKELADRGNKCAQSNLEAIMRIPADGFQEADDDITEEDLDFLEEYLGWWDDARHMFDPPKEQ